MRKMILPVTMSMSLALATGLIAVPSFSAFADSFPDEDATSVSRFGGPAVYDDNLVFDPYWYAAHHPEEYASLGYDDDALYAWFLTTGRKSDPQGVNPLFYAGDWRMDLLNDLDVEVRRIPDLKEDDTAYFALADLTADGYPELIFYQNGMQTVITASACNRSYSVIRGRDMTCNPELGLFTYTDGIGTPCCHQAVDGVFVASDVFVECTVSLPEAELSLQQVTKELSGHRVSDPENYPDLKSGFWLYVLSEVQPDRGYYETNIGGTALYHRAEDHLSPGQLQMALSAWNRQPASVRDWLIGHEIPIYLSAAQKLTPVATGFSRAGEYILITLNHSEAAENILIHEIGHQVSQGICPELTGTILSEQSEWQSLYEQYQDRIAAFTPVSKYNVYEAEEAFAETWALYTTDPESLRAQAPELYSYMAELDQSMEAGLQ